MEGPGGGCLKPLLAGRGGTGNGCQHWAAAVVGKSGTRPGSGSLLPEAVTLEDGVRWEVRLVYKSPRYKEFLMRDT